MTLKFFRRLTYILLVLIPILAFEWYNITALLGDQGRLETSIEINDSLTPNQKKQALKKVIDIEKKMGRDITVIKILLFISLPLLVFSLYKKGKLKQT